MKHLLLNTIILCCIATTYAQREFAVCDSTIYNYNIDTTVIAGRNHLWYQTSSGLSLAYDFTTSDTNLYIRDFDIIRPDLWYTLVGRRSIGDESFLYKSTDRGVIWERDTSFYAASKYDTSAPAFQYHHSVNNVQKLGKDTIVLFLGYYESGMVYSLDGGNTWEPWFRNWITHYQGILECDNHYFLWSYSGDGFIAFMFPFPKTALFTPDTGNVVTNWYPGGLYNPGCPTWSNPRCIYIPIPVNIGRCKQYHFFADTLSAACAALNTTPVSEISATDVDIIKLWPNPASDNLYIELSDFDRNRISRIKIIDMTGREFYIPHTRYYNNSISVPVQQLTSGVHILLLHTDDGRSTMKKFVKE